MSKAKIEKKKRKRSFKKFLKVALVMTAVLITAGVALLAILFIPAANAKLETAKLEMHSSTLEMFDNNGGKLDAAAALDSTVYIKLDELNSYTYNAFVAIEDKRFYEHRGVDTYRMASAVAENARSLSYKEGASTITQQLVKNTHLTNEKKLGRKAKEIALAIKMERRYSKEEILEMYLNTIYFGNNCYGIGQAAECYFNKKASELSLAESATLAAIIKAPSSYAPDKNSGKCLGRRNLILCVMNEQGYISNEEYETSLAEEIKIIAANLSSEKMQGYENAVVVQAAELLGISPAQVKNSSLRIHTFLDCKKQIALEEALLKNETKTESGKNTYKMGLIADNATGGISAFCCNSRLNLYGASRQIGSTAKPVAVYAPAFEQNLISPASPVLDEITDFGDYRPQNSQGNYSGWTTVREALKGSKNVPAVKIFNSLEKKNLQQSLTALGFIKGDENITLPMALGAFENGVCINKLSSAYMCLANGGLYKELSFIKKITDSKGRALYTHPLQENRIFSEDAAFLTTDILKDAVKTGTGKLLADLQLPVAGKTGTVGQHGCRNNSDAIFCAYTPKDTLSVWLFADSGDLLEEGTNGSTAPTAVAKEILNNIYPSGCEDFRTPDSVIRLALDRVKLNDEHKVELAQSSTPDSEKLLEFFSVYNQPKSVSGRIKPQEKNEKPNPIDDSINEQKDLTEPKENPNEENPVPPPGKELPKDKSPDGKMFDHFYDDEFGAIQTRRL